MNGSIRMEKKSEKKTNKNISTIENQKEDVKLQKIRNQKEGRKI